jgi:hypothetical protein
VFRNAKSGDAFELILLAICEEGWTPYIASRKNQLERGGDATFNGHRSMLNAECSMLNATDPVVQHSTFNIQH